MKVGNVENVGSGQTPDKVRTKVNMSGFFLHAMNTFYRKAKDYEEINEAPSEEFNSYFFGGIICTVSFLECFINEVYQELSDGPCYNFINVDLVRAHAIQELYQRNILRTTEILEKYDLFAGVYACKKLEKGISPYKDVALLIKIRNELVHHKPKWVESALDDFGQASSPCKIEKNFKKQFSLSKYHGGSPTFVPHKCMSADCLRWGNEKSKEFISSFCSDINYNYPYFKDREPKG